jgi:hypothetical protein
VICLANANCLAVARADELESEVAYIQEGDTGRVVAMLQERLSIDEKNASEEAHFGEGTLSALLAYQREHALEETGVFDDATLLSLLVVSEGAAGVDSIIWVPMHGGIRYHTNADCSDMFEPRQMSIANAAALGFTACKKCY